MGLRVERQVQDSLFEIAQKLKDERSSQFLHGIVNFHLTTFPADSRTNHKLTEVHRYSQAIAAGEKTAENDAFRFVIFGSCFPEKSSWTHGGPVTLAPRWLRVPGAVKYSGLSRSKLYELLSDGRIRSICVRSQKGAQRGVRLIDRESIDSFMESHATV